MSGKKASIAQRRAKMTEEEEREAWRRESRVAEEDELAEEERRWHPELSSRQAKKGPKIRSSASQEIRPSGPGDNQSLKTTRSESDSRWFTGWTRGSGLISSL